MLIDKVAHSKQTTFTNEKPVVDHELIDEMREPLLSNLFYTFLFNYTETLHLTLSIMMRAP